MPIDSLENLLLLEGSLPNIQTLYLSFDEVSAALPEENKRALKAIFPNLKKTIFYNGFEGRGETDKNPRIAYNQAKRLGFPYPLPGLQSLATHQASVVFSSKNIQERLPGYMA